MTYTPKTWVGTTAITATALNHAESQYSTLFTDYLSGHNHDTLYYTKALSDSTFYWSTNMGHGSGADGDTLETHHASELLAESLPVGCIVMWDDTVGSIPAGWHICDGTTVGSETTANLTNNFVAGAGTAYTLAQSFGSAAVTPTATTVTIDTHTLTEAELPTHRHSYTDYWNEGSGVSWPNYPSGNFQHIIIDDYTDHSTATDGGSASPSGHGHATSSGTYSSESNLPPYYALYYIQRVS